MSIGSKDIVDFVFELEDELSNIWFNVWTVNFDKLFNVWTVAVVNMTMIC